VGWQGEIDLVFTDVIGECVHDLAALPIPDIGLGPDQHEQTLAAGFAGAAAQVTIELVRRRRRSIVSRLASGLSARLPGGFRPLGSPALLGSRDDRPSASRRQLSFRLRRFRHSLLPLGIGPSLPLRRGDGRSPSLAHLSPLARGRFGRNGGWFRAAVKHLPDLGDLGIDPRLLDL